LIAPLLLPALRQARRPGWPHWDVVAKAIVKWNGTTWTGQTSGTTNFLHGVWGTDANNVWAVGATGTILRGP